MDLPNVEEHVDQVIAKYLKSHYNQPFGYSSTREQIVQLMILQTLQHIRRDLAAIREDLAMRETKEWTGGPR